MKNHVKKLIAPFIVVIVLVFVNIRIALILVRAALPKMIVVLGLLIPLFITVILVVVLIERIKEVRKGEEDDLGNY